MAEMKESVVRPKKNLQLRKIQNQYMIVEASAADVNMSNVYSMNKTAADLWEEISSNEHTVEELVEWLCSNYDVEADVAKGDVERQLAEWREFGLIY